MDKIIIYRHTHTIIDVIDNTNPTSGTGRNMPCSIGGVF